MANPIRVGVVGVGYLGNIHAKIYSNIPGVELVGVVDVDRTSVDKIAAQYGCEGYTDAAELIGKVDAVSIVVPTSLHLETARPFLEAGVHMLMEKPLAPSYEESLELVELAEKSGVLFQVGHLERFNGGVMELAKRVKNPRFMEVTRIGPFVARATDVDVVTDLMIHDIDIVMSLVGEPISNISAAGTRVITDHIDIANARLEFSNGVVANVTASRISNKQQRRIRVFEQEHYYGLDYTNQQITVASTKPAAEGEDFPSVVTEELEIEPRLPLNHELEVFIDTIRNGGTPLVTGRVALEAVRVAHIIKEKITACQS